MRKYRYQVTAVNGSMWVSESRPKAPRAFKALGINDHLERSLFNQAWRFLKRHDAHTKATRSLHGVSVTVQRVEI